MTMTRTIRIGLIACGLASLVAGYGARSREANAQKTGTGVQ
jgi:hypothetical protein